MPEEFQINISIDLIRYITCAELVVLSILQNESPEKT